MQLFVFAKKSIQSRVSNVEFSVENTGFLHLFPNKVRLINLLTLQYPLMLSLLIFISLQGGILVTLHVDGTKLAFISCHLAAHEVWFSTRSPERIKSSHFFLFSTI